MTQNLTILAKPLFINKFLSAYPPIGAHSTAFPYQRNPFSLIYMTGARFLGGFILFYQILPVY